MDDKPLDFSKKSVSAMAKAEILASGKQRKSEKQDKPPAERASSLLKEFLNPVQNTDTAFKQESTKSGLVFQKNKENETSESQNSIPGFPVKRKMIDVPASNSRVKRHNDFESVSDAHIKNKPRIQADPGCSEISSRDCISPKPSTSAGSSFSHKSVAIQRHSPDSKHIFTSVCEQCSKGFRDRYELDRHIRTHTGEKPFKCEHCEKTFARKDFLKNHTVRWHTEKLPYPCEECKKSFTTKSDNARHSRCHTGEKSFSCEHCGKCFSRSDSLLEHIRRHTEDRRFACNECNQKCYTKGELKSHSRSHTGERPYKCRYCSKAYRHRGTRNSHENSHKAKKK